MLWWRCATIELQRYGTWSKLKVSEFFWKWLLEMRFMAIFILRVSLMQRCDRQKQLVALGGSLEALLVERQELRVFVENLGRAYSFPVKLESFLNFILKAQIMSQVPMQATYVSPNCWSLCLVDIGTLRVTAPPWLLLQVNLVFVVHSTFT